MCKSFGDNIGGSLSFLSLFMKLFLPMRLRAVVSTPDVTGDENALVRDGGVSSSN